MSRLFSIAYLLELGIKKNIWKIMNFNPLQTKMKQIIPVINFKTKVLLQKGHCNSQKAKMKRKNRTKVLQSNKNK